MRTPQPYIQKRKGNKQKSSRRKQNGTETSEQAKRSKAKSKGTDKRTSKQTNKHNATKATHAHTYIYIYINKHKQCKTSKQATQSSK